MHIPADINRLIGGDLKKVRGIMRQCVRRQPQEIRKSLEYYFASEGKLLRPMLVLMSARAARGGGLGTSATRETVHFAAAVEFVHNASLVHDDIMDGDLLRHNRKTLHAKFGTTRAVLLGDVLHITVFDLLGRLENRFAVRMMSRTIGAMCYGQLLDVQQTKRSRENYEKIIRGKTGALMSAACAGGALMSGALQGERFSRALGRYGMYAGMLYQMVDDYLDNNAGVELAVTDIERCARKCKACLDAFPPSVYRSKLREFVDHVASMIKGG
jgi:octaprenyl-diphosphate synthase